MTYPIGLTFDDGTVTRGPAPRPTVITEPVVLDLTATSDPYGATQCDDTIRDGDVLVHGHGADRVVGFMMAAWPVALHGSDDAIAAVGFHTLDRNTRGTVLGADWWGRLFDLGHGVEYMAPRGGADYAASIKLASLQVQS